MKIPKSLQQGDTIAIVATARSVDQQILNDAISIIESWGLQVKTGPNIGKVHHQFAGTDEERASDLNWAISDPDISAIICFRGGYGSIRTMDHTDFFPLSQNPKWICGYSDVTVLHSRLHAMGVASVHSTMPINFKTNSDEALDSLRQSLFGQDVGYDWGSSNSNRNGQGVGQLVGGNLSIIYSLNGTILDLDTDGKILFLEDLDEYLYHVDRMFYNLRDAGKLEHLAGLVIGGMTDMNDHDTPFGFDVPDIILNASKEYHFPIAFDFPAGHIDDNRAMQFGRTYTLNVGPESCSLEIQK